MYRTFIACVYEDVYQDSACSMVTLLATESETNSVPFVASLHRPSTLPDHWTPWTADTAMGDEDDDGSAGNFPETVPRHAPVDTLNTHNGDSASLVHT